MIWFVPMSDRPTEDANAMAERSTDQGGNLSPRSSSVKSLFAICASMALVVPLAIGSGTAKTEETPGSETPRLAAGEPSPLLDMATGLRSISAAGWRYNRYGAGPPKYARSVLAEGIDVFLVEYLRVNEAACSKAISP